MAFTKRGESRPGFCFQQRDQKTRSECHSQSRSDRDEESRMVFIFRARFLAEFTLSRQNEILRFAQNDSVRARNDTLLERFSSPC